MVPQEIANCNWNYIFNSCKPHKTSSWYQSNQSTKIKYTLIKNFPIQPLKLQPTTTNTTEHKIYTKHLADIFYEHHWYKKTIPTIFCDINNTKQAHTSIKQHPLQPLKLPPTPNTNQHQITKHPISPIQYTKTDHENRST